ncbi:hypothetical protein BJ322DRAFT_407044, partial [Thelephora terrestris]
MGDTIEVDELINNLNDAIIEYQFSQQKAIYDQNCRLIDAAELSVLNNCRRAEMAGFRHGNRQGCLKGTRTAVLDAIELWSQNFNASPVYWLNGLAGTGKSTIAQTVAERTFADGRLGAAFFCSRDFKDRSDLRYIFPTLAFQLAHRYPEFRSAFVRLLQSNPEIFNESLYYQMETLIVEPLSSSTASVVIIIDALDECVDDDPQSAILSVMGRLVEGIPNVKFFITGRPEPRIQSGFRLELLRPLTDIFVLHEVERSIVDMDIRLFLADGLSKLATRRRMKQGDWPTDGHLDLLCERAGSLFVYAVATLKFLDHKFALPNKRLDIIFDSPGSTAYEGKAKVQPSATLDSLYLTVFKSAFDEMGAEDDERVRSVVGTVVLTFDPLPPSAIAVLVGAEEEEVLDLLQMIHSLLKLSEDPDIPVLPFHKSFPDFITDPLRCPDTRFYISPRTCHLKIALHCLGLMGCSLKQNLLSLPDYALNLEVQDLQTRVKDHLNTALIYACQSWYNHLAEVRDDVTTIIPTLQNFLQVGFLPWLEVLSVIGAARNAIVALEKLISWSQEVARDHRILSTAKDYFQFATIFFEVINVSAPHIYHSALELSPLSSIVRKAYYPQRPYPFPKIIAGISDSWDPNTSVSTKQNYLSSTWSPCSQFIATTAKEGVEIWDALALELLSTLKSTRAGIGFRAGLSYSPDGKTLAGCCEIGIIIWDTQTGGETKTIECGVTRNGLELLWSLDGKSICAFLPQIKDSSVVYVYDVTLGTTICRCTFQSMARPYVWACDKYFRITTTSVWDSRRCKVNIFEVGDMMAEVESFTFPSGSIETFSPTTYRMAIRNNWHTPELQILDIRNSEVLLQEKGFNKYTTFSLDGTLFAAFAQDHLLIWKYSSNHYARWRKFQLEQVPIQFSPTSRSIMSCFGSHFHVLHLDNFPAATKEPDNKLHGNQLDAFLPDGTFIVTAYQGESTITITNLLSQNPSPLQFIDTELEVSSIVLTGQVLLVKGSDKIVAWLLTQEGAVDGIIGNTRADCHDSLWEIPFRAIANRQSKRLVHKSGVNSNELLELSVEGEIATVDLNGSILQVYHTKTGKIIKTEKDSPHYGTIQYNLQDQHNLYPHDLCKYEIPPECNWLAQSTLQGG